MSCDWAGNINNWKQAWKEFVEVWKKKKSFMAVSYFRCMCSGPYWTHERAPELGGYNSQILFSFFLFCLVFPHRFPDHCCYCSTSPLVHQRQLVNALKCSHHFSHPLKENFEMCLPLLKEKKTFLWKKKHFWKKNVEKVEWSIYSVMSIETMHTISSYISRGLYRREGKMVSTMVSAVSICNVG